MSTCMTQPRAAPWSSVKWMILRHSHLAPLLVRLVRKNEIVITRQLGCKPFPMAFGDNFDDAIDHFSYREYLFRGNTKGCGLMVN